MKLKLHNAFHCPHGKWNGVCMAVEEPKQPSKHMKCSKQVRFLFQVNTDDGERMVGRTFRATFSYGNDLYVFLASWLDGDMERLLDDDGEIDLDVLVGREADLYIVHGPHGAQHEYPVVNIAGIFPAGSLTEE